jgi:methyl-accepting chemotaxis protein
MKIKNMKLTVKSTIIVLFVTLCFTALISWISLRMSDSLSETRYATAKAAAEIGKSVVEHYASEAKEGRLSIEDARKSAMETLRALRYEGSEYFWINDTTLPFPTMIMHTTNPALEGKVLDNPAYNVALGKNQNLFQAMVEICNKNGQGFVDYVWSKPGEAEHLRFPKMSYVVLFPEWNWVIGTGIYTDNVNTMLLEAFLPVILLSIAVIIMIVLALTLLVKSILKSIRLLMGQAEKIAAGDFTERIVLEQKDEIGILVFTLNKSMDSLEELISNIIMASQNLVRAVEEIASGNENLSQRTSEQASSLEEIAATVEETNASTRQNAGNANEANTLAETSSRLAVDGGHIVENAVLSISEINKSSKKISEIINMINEIAFQTNLLALNAAVEAARAGDQGRGFAVVAGEVRNLAQRSAGAAKEIGSLIKDSIGKIDEGTDLVNKSGDALKEIIISAKQVKDIIAEIAASSDEQSRGIEQINTAVTEMDTMTQQNAALVEETAAASEEMSNQAQELLSMVQEFKIRENLTAGTGSSKRKEVHIKTLQTRESVKTPVKSEVKSEKKYNPEHDGYEKF